eukprot:TRINITY_DN17152_c0_g1_i1.p1 TRINITY_DN17152_c0_g1~~TRINITY_DN17152_c0_g1_i1.p1  ORF type:complete len:431 (+),score=32.42 TRINITY_DN17152_c0_g1_i1:71-1363(+)
MRSSGSRFPRTLPEIPLPNRYLYEYLTESCGDYDNATLDELISKARDALIGHRFSEALDVCGVAYLLLRLMQTTAVPYRILGYHLLLARGVCLLRMERNADAVVECDRALHIIPNALAAFYIKGLACWNLGRQTQADALFASCVVLDPSFSDAISLTAGVGALRLGHTDRALRHANCVIDRQCVGGAEACEPSSTLAARSAFAHAMRDLVVGEWPPPGRSGSEWCFLRCGIHSPGFTGDLLALMLPELPPRGLVDAPKPLDDYFCSNFLSTSRFRIFHLALVVLFPLRLRARVRARRQCAVDSEQHQTFRQRLAASEAVAARLMADWARDRERYKVQSPSRSGKKGDCGVCRGFAGTMQAAITAVPRVDLHRWPTPRCCKVEPVVTDLRSSRAWSYRSADSTRASISSPCSSTSKLRPASVAGNVPHCWR